MNVIKRIFSWLGRKALLYAFIVLAIISSAFVVPWIKREWAGPRIHIERAEKLEEVSRKLEKAKSDAQRQLSASAERTKTKSLAEITEALAVAEQARALAISQRRGSIVQMVEAATLDTAAILADRRRELEIQLRNQEIAGLRAARDRLQKRNAVISLSTELRTAKSLLLRAKLNSVRARDACTLANNELAVFEGRWLVKITLQQYRRQEHENLKLRQDASCKEASRSAKLVQLANAAMTYRKEKLVAANRAYQQSRSWIDGALKSVTGEVDERIKRELTIATGSLRAKLALWAEQLHLHEVLQKAAVAMLGIALSPFLIRLFCYFVLAPAAMHRPAIRVRIPGSSGATVPLPEHSTTSIAVCLMPGEELLVRQDYLQTTSPAGTKGTQWFMDWRHPFTSAATGLTFLTRVRGDGEVTTVSAVRDPFAEVTIVTVSESGACVLQPHAIAAIVQPIRQRLRVTSHWRLFSLNAWLTMQLRYLVFHGPVRLVVKGGRGVRVERAERGRVFGQRQLLDFSADLAYSVTRTETFWPYLLGREQLLKDRIEAGQGVLIVEESPLASRSSGHVKRGIDGMIDAGMKIFGM